MKNRIIRLGNLSGNLESAWLRRPAIILTFLLYMTYMLAWWLIVLPIMSIVLVIVKPIGALIQTLWEVPRLTYNQLGDDFDEIAINWRGTKRIWREKVNYSPPTVRKKTSGEANGS